MTEISKLSVFKARNLPITAELQNKELERQLGLFQLFRKLYEHHSGLLDEILQLENLDQRSFTGLKPHYVQGVVDASVVYVITNLNENKTQSFQQAQGIWTIGRDANNGISIMDKYLSDRHAAIQYIDGQGFYLIDFSSANGSFVNGKPVHQPTQLRDGDRIRLGSVNFDFFVNHACRNLPTVAIELLMQLVPKIEANSVKKLDSANKRQKQVTKNFDNSVEATQGSGLIKSLGHQHDSFSTEEKSEILDRFLNRQSSYHPS
ncbi:MAG: FHA domain-containing protein [Goleter apudmare HA4340-LM2]|jgi:pSer/pThr/pTyr-binding forkhead associated (FHA) protein|nr:FHA domain-containing protein [Goleter apudmare HA4340-LM2]